MFANFNTFDGFTLRNSNTTAQAFLFTGTARHGNILNNTIREDSYANFGALGLIMGAAPIAAQPGKEQISGETGAGRDGPSGSDGVKVLAEGEGFEPPVPFRAQRFSRPPVSTTHPSLRGAGN